MIDLAIDTSALTAILLGEPEAADLLQALAAAPQAGLCAPNRTELLMVIGSRLGDVGVERARALLAGAHPDGAPGRGPGRYCRRGFPAIR